MNAALSSAATSTGQISPEIIQTASGNAAAATIEPSEMYRDHATTATNTTSTAAKASGVKHKNAPTKLATALPPRNDRKTVYAWPSITTTAAAAIQRTSPPVSLPADHTAT